MVSRLPHGSWPTPITSELVVRAAARLGEVCVDGDDVWWSESRPGEGGRTAVVRRSGNGTVTDVLPAPWNARTRVHEYGGGAWTVSGGTLWFTEFSDQRLYRLDAGSEEPVAVSAAPTMPSGVRYADLHVTGDAVLAVRETHAEGDRPADVVNELVRVAADGTAEVLVSGPDFVSDPRLAPDGITLSWLQWNHPAMPWDAAQLVVRGADGTEHVLAGGPGESVVAPRWDDDLTLWWLSDRSDVWSLYRVGHTATSSSSSTSAATSPGPSGSSGRVGTRCSTATGSPWPTAGAAPTGWPCSSRTAGSANSTCRTRPSGP